MEKVLKYFQISPFSKDHLKMAELMDGVEESHQEVSYIKDRLFRTRCMEKDYFSGQTDVFSLDNL